MGWLVGWQHRDAATPELAEEIENSNEAQKWLQDELMWLAADLTDKEEAEAALYAAQEIHDQGRVPYRNPPEKRWQIGEYEHFIIYQSSPTG